MNGNQSQIIYCNFITTVTLSSLVPLRIQLLVQQFHCKAECHPVSSLQYQNSSNYPIQDSSFSENNNSDQDNFCHTDTMLFNRIPNFLQNVYTGLSVTRSKGDITVNMSLPAVACILPELKTSTTHPQL
jgi:hypothetical protein